MALAHSAPRGLGTRPARAVSEFLARPRQTSIQRVLGWVGLAGLTALWLQFTVVALRIHSVVAAYEDAHGPALAQFEGRAQRAPEFEQLQLTLEGIKAHESAGLALGFPISLLVLFGFWVGCSRWALAHRPVVWRRTFVLAALVVAAQAVLIYPEINAFSWITE